MFGLEQIESLAVILSVLLALWALLQNATGRIRPLLEKKITLSKLLRFMILVVVSLGVMWTVILAGISIVQLRDDTDEFQRFQSRVSTWHRDFNNSQFKNFEWYHSQGPREVKMIVKDAGICYLTQVSGRFDGDWEEVFITKKDGHWILSGKSDADKYVAAKATCWVFPPPIQPIVLNGPSSWWKR